MNRVELDKKNIFKSILNQNGKKVKESSENEKEESKEILERILRKIKRKFPYLIQIINHFVLCPVDIPINISTDFKRLYFNPGKIKELDYNETNEIEFQLMHIIIHGLLADNESILGERQSKYLWLAQDQRVNYICESLGITGNRDRVFYQNQMRQNEPYKSCFANYYLTSKNPVVKKKAKAAQRLIASDEHFFWHPEFVNKVINNSDETEEEKDKTRQIWSETRKIIDSDEDELAEADLKNITDRIRKNSSNDMQQQGDVKGGFVENYDLGNGRPLSYRELLKTILTVSESQKENLDSIDPMLYQYGLDIYGDVPLIEPKEIDEQLQIDTICVAIDTSGSCTGEIASKFLRETHAIINDMQDYLGGTEIIFFQCDCDIQLEERVGFNEIDLSTTAMGQLRGFGGTSFIPVFRRVEEIIEIENKKIAALIYLTDGYGDFPEEEYEFPTIFVIDKHSNWENMDIPEWIALAVMED